MSAMRPETTKTTAFVEAQVQIVQTAILVICVSVGACVVLVRDELLGDRFFADGLKIQAIAQGQANDLGDASYGIVATLYSALGMADNPTFAAFFGYGAFVLVMYITFRQFGVKRLGWYGLFTLCIAFLLGAVYLGFYSKDVFVLAIVVALLIPHSRYFVDGIVVGFIIIYGLYFRQYWLLIGGVYLFYRWYFRKPRAMFTTTLVALSTVALLSFAIHIFTGSPPDYFRTAVNVSRLQSADAATMIKPFFSPGQPVSGALNNLATLVTLILPIPLLLLGGAYYAGLFACITLMWSTVLVAARRFLGSAYVPGLEQAAGLRAWCLLAAFVSIQALFEPDYGSAVRHLTPLLPLVFIVVWASHGRQELRLQGHGRHQGRAATMQVAVSGRFKGRFDE